MKTCKWALVTGASGGIGSEICRQLAEKGYSLVLCGRDVEKLHLFAAELTVKSVVVAADLATKKGIEEVRKIFDLYDISVFVCNAGMGYVGETVNQSDILTEDMISVMVTAPTLLAKHFIKTSAAEHLLTVSSVAGFAPDPYMNVYGSCKAYLNDLTLALRYETKENISVSLLIPGPVATEFDKRAGCTAVRSGLNPAICAKRAVRGMLKGKKVIFPSFSARCCHAAMKLLPEAIMTPIIGKIQKYKIQ